MDHPVRRPRGRPLLYREGPTTTISCSVPVSLHDRLCHVAHAHGWTLSAATCKVLMLGLRDTTAATTSRTTTENTGATVFSTVPPNDPSR
jgi:hypothetical protein